MNTLTGLADGRGPRRAADRRLSRDGEMAYIYI